MANNDSLGYWCIQIPAGFNELKFDNVGQIQCHGVTRSTQINWDVLCPTVHEDTPSWVAPNCEIKLNSISWLYTKNKSI